jgi:hypothetical protein
MMQKHVMKFKIDDVEYAFDFEMTIAEAMRIQEKAHVAPRDLWAALDRQDPATVAAFVFMVRRRNGEAIKEEDVLKQNILSFHVLPPEEPEVDAESGAEEEGADPTSKPGKTRKAATKSSG